MNNFIKVEPFNNEGDRLRYTLVRSDAIAAVDYGVEARGQCTLLVDGMGISVTRESGDRVCDALGLVKPGDRA